MSCQNQTRFNNRKNKIYAEANQMLIGQKKQQG